MEIEKKKQLLESHFPGEVEMLPESIIEELLNKGDVEVIEVTGANQLDLVSVISIIKLALDCIKFIYDTFINQKDKTIDKVEIMAMISKKYPQIVKTLGPKGVTVFINDICSK